MLGLSDPDTPPERLVNAWLASRQALLVLDYCEHLADAAAAFSDQVLRAAPHLQIIATSREPLGVQGEIQMPVRPLLPDAAAELFV